MGDLANGGPVGNPEFVYDAERGSNVLYLDQDVNEHIDCNAGWGDMNHMSFTLSVWEKQKDTCDWAYFVGKGQSSYKLQYGFQPWLTNRINFWTHEHGCAPAQVLDNGTWYHVAATWEQIPDANGGTARIYIDGKLATEEAWDGAYRNSGDTVEPPVTMGANRDEIDDPPRVPGTVKEYFKGYLDDVRMYDRQLSEEEIMWLAGLPPTTTNYYAILPPASYADISSPEPKGQKIINFKDMAKMAQEWLQSADWPVIP